MYPKPSKKERKPKRVKPVSDKRLIEQRLYRGLRWLFLKDHPVCQAQVCCEGAASQEVHHRRGRGRFLLAVFTWLAVCWQCHRHLTENPQEAYELGFSTKRNTLGEGN